MRPTSVSVVSGGSSSPIVLDYWPNPFAVGLAVVVSGSVGYTVKHTYDDPANYASGTYTLSATWFPYSGAGSLSGGTANSEGAYTTPRRACMLFVSSGGGTTAATLTAIQSVNAG